MLFVNAEDADALGVAEGDAVDMASETGEMRALRARIFDVPRGTYFYTRKQTC